MEVIINQLVTGHTKLNSHMSKISEETESKCSHCNEVETVRHFIFECNAYEEERTLLLHRVQEVLLQFSQGASDINLRMLAGLGEGDSNMKLQIRLLFESFLQTTKRFQ